MVIKPVKRGNKRSNDYSVDESCLMASVLSGILLIPAILSRFLPEKRLMRFWSSHSPILSMKSSGSFSWMVMSWDRGGNMTLAL